MGCAANPDQSFISKSMDLAAESRTVMTLDAGGTNLRFSAMRGCKPVTETVSLPSNGDDLTRCLANIIDGFTQVKALCPEPPSAISFAFPGPADYPNGIIGDLGNLPGFRGGVALGPMLEDQFHIPVFINNDGDLFVYGEAMIHCNAWASACPASAPARPSPSVPTPSPSSISPDLPVINHVRPNPIL
jgi:hypothetical protein